MLNYETLLSSYDDKLTLLQWLKKVEAALKDASAVSFKVNKKGDATLTFSIVFEDGSEIESGEIVLQQGESVESAAIVNGHLILTLTNGDELDAGQLLNGDLNVSGNLAATGEITCSGIKADGFLAPSTASLRVDKNFNTTLSGSAPTEQGFSFGYTHARVSNGKLSNVLVLKLTATSTPQSSYLYLGSASVTLPTAIANSLVVAEEPTITTKSIPLYYFVSGDASLIGTLYFRADKHDNVLVYNIYYRSSAQLAEGKTIAVRLEDNYIL